MPNHTSNRVRLFGSPEILQTIREKHFPGAGTLDFNTVVPMPSEIADTTSGTISWLAGNVSSGNYQRASSHVPGIENCQSREDAFAFLQQQGRQDLVDATLRHEQLMRDYGAADWYDWSTRNWGTKWNAYDGSVDVCGTILEAFFNTAWSPPTPVLVKLSEMYPQVRMEADALDEGGGFAVTEVYRNGESCKSRDWEWSQMARDVFGFDVDEDEDGEDKAPPAAPQQGLRGIHLS